MREAAKSHQMILFLLGFSILAQILSDALPLSLVLMIGQVFSLLLPLLIYLIMTGGRFAQRLSLNPFKGVFLFRGIVVTLLLQPFLMLLATAVERIAGNPMEALIISMTAYPAWMTLTGLAVMPALLEELTFRGALLNGYRRLPLWSAAILNGIVFGMFHMNLYQFSYAMVLGVFFSVVTRQSGSVLPAVAMHFLNNAISVLLIYQGETRWVGILETALAKGTAPGLGMAAGLAVGVLSMGSALWLLRRAPEAEDTAVAEPEAREKFWLPSLIFDWAFIAVVLVFWFVAVAAPLKTLLAGA